MRKLVTILLIIVLGAFFYSCNTQPDLKNPKQFKIENIDFSMPNNWYEGKNGEDEKLGFKWTNIKSPDNFVFGIQHYNKRYDYNIDDLADYFLNNLKSKMKEYLLETEVLSNRKRISIQIMGKEIEGIEIEYKNRILNVDVNQRTKFFQIVTDSTTCLFTATTNIDDWEKEQKGFDLIMKTIKVE
ncbi:hypothetical protein [Marinifilum flexuosum]|uniref:hypothetical protein n=1 Tax=Marinifilum flexuosum TaxID=1117708 RepID=UPI0024913B91|nr:hypothetical protein [Marinifilum flexuosum]